MSDIEAAADLSCPFCREPDFDAVGLKWHLSQGDCYDYETTPSPARTVRLGSPARAHATRGEPVAWCVYDAMNRMCGGPYLDHGVADTFASRTPWPKEGPFTVVPLYARPTPPPATGEADPDPRGEDREAVEAAREHAIRDDSPGSAVEIPATEPCATDDAIVANLRAAAEIQGRPPTWGEIRYLLAHIDRIRGYAETGEDVEGVLIQANLDDFEQTPGETVLWLIDRICSAETALFLGANDPDIERSPVGDCARAHFKKYPNGIRALRTAERGEGAK